MYHINITRMPAGPALGGAGSTDTNKTITLINDTQDHQVEVQLSFSQEHTLV